MMTSRGLSDSPLFTVPESGTDTEGLLPPEAVAPIVGWLHDLAADPKARQAVVSQTLDGAVRHNVLRTHDIADALDAQIDAAGHLYAQAEEIYAEAATFVARESSDGTLLSGEVLAQWQEFVGTGEMVRSVEERVTRIRERLVEGVTGKRTRSTEVAEAVEAGLQSLVVGYAESAAEARHPVLGRRRGRPRRCWPPPADSTAPRTSCAPAPSASSATGRRRFSRPSASRAPTSA